MRLKSKRLAGTGVRGMLSSRQGALAAKVCGAGGGGCVVFLTEPEDREHVSAAIRSYGGHVLPAMVARDGLTVSGPFEPVNSV